MSENLNESERPRKTRVCSKNIKCQDIPHLPALRFIFALYLAATAKASLHERILGATFKVIEDEVYRSFFTLMLDPVGGDTRD